MEDSLNVRFDELEQELIRLLSLRADDLQLFSSRQDQLLQSHYHSLTSTLQTARTQLERTKGNSGALHKQEIRERWIERQNLKRFWVYCEEIQRQKQQDMIGNCSYLDRVEEAASNSVYQTPNQNDSTTNISTTSLSKLQDLSLD